MSDDAELAARTLPVLMDTRAEALHALQTLNMSRPHALSAPLQRAEAVARRITLECASLLAQKHAGAPSVRVAAETAGIDGGMRAFDARQSDLQLAL